VRYGLRKTTREGVAVKIITKDPSAAPSSSRIGQEVAILRHCNRMACPYLVRLHDAFETDTLVYMVLEYCPGSLSGRLAAQERGTLAEAEARRLTRQIASALQALHGEGVVHRGAPGPVAGARSLAPSLDEPEQIAAHSSESARRAPPPHHPHLPLTPSRACACAPRPNETDLKPENILLTARDGCGDGDVKLSDFGLAKRHACSPTTMRTHSPCGTPGFVAPEVLAHMGCAPRLGTPPDPSTIRLSDQTTALRSLPAESDYPIRRPRSLPAESAAHTFHLSRLVRIR